jgi:hypothetical protein
MYYYVRFPDVGAGATRLACYVESESEAAVRELAADHPRFRSWDTSKGTVRVTNLANRKSLENRIMNVTNPNAAVLEDGTVLRRSLDRNEVVEHQSDRV